MLKVCHTT